MKKTYFRLFIIILGLLFLITSNVYATNTEKSVNDSEMTLLNRKENQLSVADDYKVKYGSEDEGKKAYIVHQLRIYIVPLTCIIGMVCFISLILSCIRKNVCRSIFSAIGILLSTILCVSVSHMKASFVVTETTAAMVMCIVPIVVEIVIGIVAVVFCFKSKGE